MQKKTLAALRIFYTAVTSAVIYFIVFVYNDNLTAKCGFRGDAEFCEFYLPYTLLFVIGSALLAYLLVALMINEIQWMMPLRWLLKLGVLGLGIFVLYDEYDRYVHFSRTISGSTEAILIGAVVVLIGVTLILQEVYRASRSKAER